MSRAPETAVVESVRKAIKSQYPGCFVMKIHGSMFSATGFPDLLVLVEGRAYCLEIKHVKSSETPDEARERCSARQRLLITELRKAGASADCVTSAGEALAVLSGHPWFFLPETLDPEPI